MCVFFLLLWILAVVVAGSVSQVRVLGVYYLAGYYKNKKNLPFYFFLTVLGILLRSHEVPFYLSLSMWCHFCFWHRGGVGGWGSGGDVLESESAEPCTGINARFNNNNTSQLRREREKAG